MEGRVAGLTRGEPLKVVRFMIVSALLGLFRLLGGGVVGLPFFVGSLQLEGPLPHRSVHAAPAFAQRQDHRLL